MWFINKLKENKLPAILLAAGLLLFAILFLWDREGSAAADPSEPTVTDAAAPASAADYSREIEQKLEAVLKRVEGVGQVQVAVSLEDYGEICLFPQEDLSEDEVRETDSSGGSRESTSASEKREVSVFKNSDGSESPVIRKSLTPVIKGVIVCAGGADSYTVQERIFKAVKAFCHIGADRIQILPMGE